MALRDIETTPADPTDEGVRARARGRGRDACPYALGSEEREEWLEGYDGRERVVGR